MRYHSQIVIVDSTPGDQSFEREIHGLLSFLHLFSHVGRCLVREVLSVGNKLLLIVPYIQGTAAAPNSIADSNARVTPGPGFGLITCQDVADAAETGLSLGQCRDTRSATANLVGTGSGASCVMEFSPVMWPYQRYPAQEARGRFERRAVFIHELLHAMRMLKGQVSKRPVALGSVYPDIEEFYAVIFENMLRCEIGQPLRWGYNFPDRSVQIDGGAVARAPYWRERPQAPPPPATGSRLQMRGALPAEVPLPLPELARRFAEAPQYRDALVDFAQRNNQLCRSLAQQEIAFNPFRHVPLN